jgi:cytochrome oxidase Cu insertion factor (SCO1/SenC/PrrC family)
MKKEPVFLMIVMLMLSIACNSQQSTTSSIKDKASDSDKIEAYYFHFTARCSTCKTIEADTKKNLETLYPEQIRVGLITFQSLNLDEEPSRVIAKRLGVSGQTLLLVKGEQKINLTNEGFLYAVSKPDKFKEIINEKVEFLLTVK